MAGVGVTRSQDGRNELTALPVEDEQGMVDVLLVVAVVVAAFLIAMGGIVGRVEVEQNLLRSRVFGAFSQIELKKNSCHQVAGASRNRILKPGDGGLGSQLLTTLGQRTAHHLEQRIFAKGVGVVLILVTARYLVDALLEQRHQGVASFPLSPLWDVLGHGLAQAEFFVYFGEPEQPAVGGEPPTVEGGLKREGRRGLKLQLVCGTIFHRREPPSATVESSNNPTIAG